MTIKKGDTVRIIAGKDQGKQGTVHSVIKEENRLTVENLNIRTRHLKPNQQRPKGGIVQIPGPMDRSNVILVCPHCSNLTRGRMVVTDGVKSRTCSKCNNILDLK